MHARESIPNVGRRAQERQAGFVLKGNRVRYGPGGPGLTPSCLTPFAAPPCHSDQRSTWRPDRSVRQWQVPSAEVWTNSADRSLGSLFLPGHPHNRVIQSILRRRQVSQALPLRQELPETKTSPRKPAGPPEQYHSSEIAWSSSRSSDTTVDRHRQKLAAVQTAARQRIPPKERRRRQVNERVKISARSILGYSAEASSPWKIWSCRPIGEGKILHTEQLVHADQTDDGYVAWQKRASKKERRLVNASLDDCDPEGKSYKEAEESLATNYRSWTHKVSAEEEPRVVQADEIGTCKNLIEHSTDIGNSSEIEKQLLKQAVLSTETLDDLLEYYWVYQGMGRQVLELRDSQKPKDRYPSGAGCERKKKLVSKKPLKFPPLPISSGQRAAALVPLQHDRVTSPVNKTEGADRLTGCSAQGIDFNVDHAYRDRPSVFHSGFCWACLSQGEQRRIGRRGVDSGYNAGKVRKVVVQMPAIVGQELTFHAAKAE